MGPFQFNFTFTKQQPAVPPAFPTPASAPAQNVFDPFNSAGNANQHKGNYNMFASVTPSKPAQEDAVMDDAPMAHAPPQGVGLMGPPKGNKRARDGGDTQNAHPGGPFGQSARRKVLPKVMNQAADSGHASAEDDKGLAGGAFGMTKSPTQSTGLWRFANFWAPAPAPLAAPVPEIAFSKAPPPPPTQIRLPFMKPANNRLVARPDEPFHVFLPATWALLEEHEYEQFALLQWAQITSDYSSRSKVAREAAYAAKQALAPVDAMSIGAPAAKRARRETAVLGLLKKAIPSMKSTAAPPQQVSSYRPQYLSLHQGKSLEEQFGYSAIEHVGMLLPRPMAFLFVYLTRDDVIKKQGIFRSRGLHEIRLLAHHKVAMFANDVSSSEHPSLIDSSWAYEMADLFKQFLADVPGHVVPEKFSPLIREAVEPFLAARTDQNKEYAAQVIRRTLSCLSPWNLAMLACAILMGERILAEGRWNLLVTRDAIAALLGPTVFHESDVSNPNAWDWIPAAFELLMEKGIDWMFLIHVNHLPVRLQRVCDFPTQ
ncbi:hypothetical protein GGF31_007940 [Allomyces arbusculus]|nr:hypothetical protein GGF31_007940 [Allomyces arbusculus]